MSREKEQRTSVLFCFYSQSGHTAKVVNDLTTIFKDKGLEPSIEELSSDELDRSVPGQIKTAFFSFFNRGVNLSAPIKYDPQNFDVIVFFGPIWSFTLNSVSLSWLKKVKFNFSKSIVGFSACGKKDGFENTISQIEGITKHQLSAAIFILEHHLKPDSSLEYRLRLNDFTDDLIAQLKYKREISYDKLRPFRTKTVADYSFGSKNPNEGDNIDYSKQTEMGDYYSSSSSSSDSVTKKVDDDTH